MVLDCESIRFFYRACYCLVAATLLFIVPDVVLVCPSLAFWPRLVDDCAVFVPLAVAPVNL